MSPPEALRNRLAPGLSLAEPHAHTLASDGLVSAADLVRAAARASLAVICITDHDRIGDLTEAMHVGAELSVDVVRGEEVTASFPPGIHVVGLYLDRQIRMHMPVADTIDAIHEQGGLAIVAHPFMPTWFASAGAGTLRRLLESRRVDGIELRHTAPVLPGTWKRLDAFYREHADRIGAALGAGDSHFGEHDLGRMVTVFPGRTAADLRAAIEARTTSPLAGVSRPVPPSLAMRLKQQYRSMVWLELERRSGRAGSGAGPGRHGAPRTIE